MKKVILLLLASVMFACASATSVYGYKISGASSRIYSRVLILFRNSDLVEAKRAESIFVNVFAYYGVSAYSGVDVIATLQSHDEGRIIKSLEERGIDALLVIEVKEFKSEVVRTQEGYEASGYVSYYGDYSYFNANVRKKEGYPISVQRIAVEASLFDVQTGSLVWVGEVRARGVYSSYQVMVMTAARELVNKLAKDGLLGCSSSTPDAN